MLLPLFYLAFQLEVSRHVMTDVDTQLKVKQKEENGYRINEKRMYSFIK